MSKLPQVRCPARRPCASCPYRRDVPSGVWAEQEYDKLPRYDLDTANQPVGAFMCHQQNGRLCAGWVGCHDMDENMGLRFLILSGQLSDADVNATLDYTTDVPLFSSGAEAAAHGRAKIADPDLDARRTMAKVTRRQQRVARSNDAT